MEAKTLDGRTASILRGVARFCWDNGLDCDPSALVRTETIEAYLIKGLTDRASSTKGTYRWVLTRTLGLDLRVDLSFRGSMAAKAYSQHERSELICVASSQKKAWRRSSALAMIALSIGAGVRAEELRYIKGRHLAKDGNHIAVGDRMVPIKSPWDEIMASIGRDGDEFLFHPDAPKRSSKNFINGFASHLTRDPACPRFQMARGRSSFICGRWNEGVSLRELLWITGIREVESLIRYVHLLDAAPDTKAGLRHRLAKGNH